MFYPFCVALSRLLFWTSMLSYKNAAESFQGQDKSGDYCIFSPFFVFWKKPKGEKYIKTEQWTVEPFYIRINAGCRLDSLAMKKDNGSMRTQKIYVNSSASVMKFFYYEKCHPEWLFEICQQLQYCKKFEYMYSRSSIWISP